MPLANLPTLLLVLFTCTCVPAQTIYTYERDVPQAEQLTVEEKLQPFYHGVASGDPLADRVVIWTRITPDTLEGQAISVSWKVATDPGLQSVIREGSLLTDQGRDYTVKVDVDGLSAGTTYYYGFTALERNSLTGRTKTTPTGEQADHLRFGVVSCNNFQAGYFNAFARLAERNDLDAVVHLGDYIYELANFVYGSAEIWEDRIVEPDRETVTLFDYRTRYATYRLDEDLRRMHQQHPIISVWDDHESANNSYEDGASNHQPDGEGPWQERKDRSRQAYFEWMPIRDPGHQSIYRKVSYGEIADLIMLDTRLEGRDKQILDVTDPALQEEDRTMLGETQKEWFLDQLANSTAKWKLVGQQVIFSPFDVGWSASLVGQTYEFVQSAFLDSWDGYPAERRQLTDFIAERGIENVVLLAGDSHASFAFEVAESPVEVNLREIDGLGRVAEYLPGDYDPEDGTGAVAVEFAAPSVTSANFDETGPLAVALFLQRQINSPIIPNDTLTLGNPNPHMKFANLSEHGYYVLDVKQDSVRADYFFSPILERSSEEEFAAGFTSVSGSHRLRSAEVPAAPKATGDLPAPADPPGLTGTRYPVAKIAVLAVSPNPATDRISVQYAVKKTGRVLVTLLDAGGRRVRVLRRMEQLAGVYTLESPLGDLPTGTYYLQFTLPGGVGSRALLIH